LDDARIYPRPICNAAPGTGQNNDSIVFSRWVSRSSFVLQSHIPEVWELWGRFTGLENVEQICGSVSFNSVLARQLIAGLFQQQLVVDASKLTVALHAITNNPPLFPSQITTSEVLDVTKTPDLGIQQGRVVCGFDTSIKTGPLFDLLKGRSSIRRFSGTGLDRGRLGRLLMQAYSTVIKPTASAGGLYPLRIYFMLTFDQAGLSAGLYQFDPSTHNVVRLRALPEERELEFALNSDTRLGKAPLIVVVASSPDRHVRKYGNRGTRYTQAEAGMAIQNLVVGVAEMGMGTLVYGGFNDDVLAGLFGMDPVISRPELAVAVGFAQPGKPNDAAALLGRLKANLPVGSNLVFSGSAIEPLGGYQVRVRLEHGEGEDFIGTGVAPSFDDAHLRAVAEAYERQVTAAFSRVDRFCTAAAIQERWVDPRVAAPMTVWQQEVFGLSNFSHSVPWPWVRGRAWVGGEPVFVPFDMVGYKVSARFRRLPCVRNSSSGVAVHTTKREAERRALLELLERDALMRYWLTRRVPRRIRIEALPQFLQKRVAQLQAEGKSVDVLNFSDDGHGVAVIGVAIYGPTYPCFLLGMAASDQHWQAAALKAFTEADLTDGGGGELDGVLSVADVRSVRHHSQLYAQPTFAQNAMWLCQGEFGPVPRAKPLAEIVDMLSPVVVDLTGDGTPLVGVRVVCPELVPIAFGYMAAHFTHLSLKGVMETQIDLPVPFG
jgi:thiazole/oxazole-forming peptide maturase SagD family component